MRQYFTPAYSATTRPISSSTSAGVWYAQKAVRVRPSFFSLRPSSFFFNDTATTEIYTLSLHDALPIFRRGRRRGRVPGRRPSGRGRGERSEEHTSELQSRPHIVCRLLLEKKKKNT